MNLQGVRWTQTQVQNQIIQNTYHATMKWHRNYNHSGVLPMITRLPGNKMVCDSKMHLAILKIALAHLHAKFCGDLTKIEQKITIPTSKFY